MRGELEVSCFYFIHKMAHIKYIDNNKNVEKTSNPNRNNTIDYTQNSQNTVAEDMIPEEETILGAFNQYLHTFQDTILVSVHPHVLAVLFSPLCSLVPRVLQKLVCHIFSNYSPNSTTIASSTLESQLLKTRILRIVVAVQQTLSLLFQSTSFDTESKRKLIDILTDEFEKLRRFVTLFNMPMTELEVNYIDYYFYYYY